MDSPIPAFAVISLIGRSSSPGGGKVLPALPGRPPAQWMQGLPYDGEGNSLHSAGLYGGFFRDFRACVRSFTGMERSSEKKIAFPAIKAVIQRPSWVILKKYAAGNPKTFPGRFAPATEPGCLR